MTAIFSFAYNEYTVFSFTYNGYCNIASLVLTTSLLVTTVNVNLYTSNDNFTSK